MTIQSQSGLTLPKSNEAEVRSLALAKAKTDRAYTEHLYTSTKNFSDEQLVDYELELVRLRKAADLARRAFEVAV